MLLMRLFGERIFITMSNIEYKMRVLNADGVDFHPIMQKREIGTPHMKVFASYTKDEFVNVKYIPKSCYTFWKMVDGRKEYMLD